ncbi:MAG TPA: flagellar basal body P-ring protein FlgI [Bacteriovoracaceae bacterium]|nr:flagellar basal body P-ring protein FlgI [Bacteriovoracaceae bacterium]
MIKLLPLVLFSLSLPVFATQSRIKDLVSVKGVRENSLIGYGLVIGLNGTGDGGGEITNTSLKKMFQTLGLNPQKEVTSKNVAAVIVTAKLPAFGRLGQKLDVTVSSIGDASSLAGGTLLVTPLKGGDSQIYSVASGALSIGGLEKGKKFATTARIPDGGIIEKELEVGFNDKKALRLALNNPDFTTAARIERTVNQELGGKYATASDSATIDVIIPSYYERKVVELLANIENFKVVADVAAKIVINERTGTLVAGGDIVLKRSAVSHRDMVLEVKGGGEGSGKAVITSMEQATTINDLVKALNALGTTPEDLISIFQALKQNGSLLAEIELI